MTRSSRGWVVPVVVAVIAAIIGSGFVILFVDTDTAGASVVLESVTDPGADPFTRSVAVGELADFPTTIAPITATVTADLATDTTTGGLTATGNAPGLYGGTGNESVCDPTQLADYLTATPTKAAAWATTLGITTRSIPTYIAGLTPVVLTTDTRVTNHGYANGAATPRQAVLQAGTAVLVDNHGIPRVKCGCGNPLTEPAAQPIDTTTGTPWTGYQPDTVTTITPTPRPQPTLTLTDITTGDTYTQPTGDAGVAGDGAIVAYANAVQQGEDPPEPKPFLLSGNEARSWAEMDGTHPTSVAAIAYGQGKYVAVSDHEVLVSDGGEWRQAARLTASLRGVAFGDGKWLAVGDEEDTDITGVVFQSSDGESWTQITAVGSQPGSQRSYETVDLAYGDGTWAALAYARAPDPVGNNSTALVLLTSTDAKNWSQQVNFGRSRKVMQLAFGSGRWYGFGTQDDFQTTAVSTSDDLVTWSDVVGTPMAGDPMAVAFGAGHWYLSTLNGENLSTLLWESADGTSWRRVPDPQPRAILALAVAT